MKLVKKLSVIVATLLSLLILSVPVVVLAQDTGTGGNTGGSSSGGGNQQAVCDGLALTGGSCQTDPNPQINKIITAVINAFSLIIGITAVIMIMVGGFKYITSSGDSNSVNSAKNTILYAIIGLIVVALAQVLVNFVLKKASEAPAAPSASQQASNAIKDAVQQQQQNGGIKKTGQ